MKEWTIEEIREALEQVPSFHPYPTSEERDRWHLPEFKETMDAIVERAGQMLDEPLLPALATDYLSFIRTGSREHWTRAFRQRTNRLDTFVMAECIEGKGRFLDVILDSGWVLCECSAWCPPWHSPGYTLPDPAYFKLDLTVAHLALRLAQSVYLIGRAMDQYQLHWKARILYELDTRVWRPYLERDNHRWWLKPVPGRVEVLNNWTAVCNSGIVGSALLCMDDLDHLAKMIHRALWSLGFYLDSFAEDGGCPEGVSYWHYGFGNYVRLRNLLYQRTGGVVDLFADERIRPIAVFPLQFIFSGDRCVNFSDCDGTFRPAPWLSASLWKHLGIGNFGRLARRSLESARQSESIGGMAHTPDLLADCLELFFHTPEEFPSGSLIHEPCVYRPSLEWMISRHDPSDEETLILAVKGGHNGEHHNQNDGGNFIVHWRGESLVADLGRGTYTKDYFGPKRYEHLVCSSRGHSVPLPNDVEQAAGRNFAARVLAHRSSPEKDTIVLDLKGLYPEPAGLDALQRTVSLVREGTHGFVELTDEMTFSSENRCDFLVPIYSFHIVEIVKPGLAQIRGDHGSLRVEYNPEIVEGKTEIIPTDDQELVRRAKGDGISRLVFRFNIPARHGILVLRFIPETKTSEV